MTLREQVARELSGHFGPVWEHLPTDRAERRKLERQGVDFNGNDREEMLDAARAAIRVVLEAAAGVAEAYRATGYMSDRERDYCHEHGEEIAIAIRQLATPTDEDAVRPG